jgi:uncharacterized coiled-coil protein SlyX
MGIAVVMICGFVAMTLIAAGFDYLGKRAKRADPELEKRVAELERRVEILDATVADKNEKLLQLQTELSFVNRLLDKNAGK